MENVRNLASHDHGNTWKVIHDSLVGAGYNVLDNPVIFSPHYIGVPQHRERVFIMCIRKDIEELPPFYFNLDNIPKCKIDDILLSDNEIDDIDQFRLKPEMIEWIENWNVFLRGIKCDKLPGFPVWADSLCAMEDNPMIKDWDNLPKWMQNFIKKNSELWEKTKSLLIIG